MTRTLLSIVGTRPEAIKMAPVVKELRKSKIFDVQLVSTGQHRELLRQTLNSFGLAPDLELGVMQANQSLGGLTANLISALDPVFDELKPDMVIGQGDTTSVMVASLLSFYRRIPFSHVEAGLRTGDIHSPFPEEFNRTVAGRVAALHFAPTQRSVDNLLREGVESSRIHLTGNTVIDALLWMSKRVGAPSITTLPGRRLILVTCHRRENFGKPMQNIFEALKRIITYHPDCEIVFPVHPNPNVRNPVYAKLGNESRIHLVDPLCYEDLVSMMKASYFVMTDSGGIQEEAPSLCKPVLVLRESTERPEAVEAGVAEIVGVDQDKIFERASRLLSDPVYYARVATGANPYGDGLATGRIVSAINSYFQ